MSRKNTGGMKVALRWRRTKIVATLGPASSRASGIADLVAAGVDVFRVNMSHGEPEIHRKTVERIRRVAARVGRHIAILMDLCGPKIRVGSFRDGCITLDEGQRITVTTRPVLGEDNLIPSQYRSLHKDLKKGERILLDDGKLELRVLGVDGTEIQCKVVYGGVLSNHKGMNLPNSELSTTALTSKDRKDVQLGVDLGVDFFALSFVRAARDVQQLQRYLARLKADIPVISKIERPEAVDNICEIMDVSYGIMIARGDLGIELPAEKVPLIQTDLIAKARQKGIPVIVATQMLESMMQQTRPTRAEVTDVAGAAMMSTDAVMLSGETAVGKYPVQSVRTMDRVLREVERHQWELGSFASEPILKRGQKVYFIRESMAHAAVQMSQDLGLETIVVPTSTGTTARIMAAHRPLAPQVGASDYAMICRRLALHWGVVPVQIKESQKDWRQICIHIDACCGLAQPGHDILLVSGFREDPAESEPVLKILHLQ